MMAWICETCGETIKQEGDGWLEWKIDSRNGAKHSFRLVHDMAAAPNGRSCQYNFKSFPEGEGLGDLQLEQFTGDDGLMTLLEFLSDNPQSADEIIEMIKRIHIPGYESARRHFKAAIRDGVFEPNTKPGFHSTRDIDATNAWAAKRG